jgi:antitoxin VapB
MKQLMPIRVDGPTRSAYIPLGYTNKEVQVARSTVFTTNRSQAVRLPKPVVLPPSVRQVEITKLGRSRLISPADQSWDTFFDGPGASNDFMAERRQPPVRKREQF